MTVDLGEQDRRQADRHEIELRIVGEPPAEPAPQHPERRVVDDGRRVAQRLPLKLSAGHSIERRRGKEMKQVDLIESSAPEELKERKDRQNQ